jgi:TrmH family RNA methyltransferase
MGAHFRLPIQVCSDWEQLTATLGKDVALYVADVNATMGYDQVDWLRPSALIVGGEVEGPSNVALAVAHPISIPMHGRADSLNAAMAGTVILFEAARQRRLIASNTGCSGIPAE